MWNNHFCIALGGIFDIPFAEEVKIAKAVGFDGFFTNWNKPGCLDEPRALADELGMLYQSVHAPFGRMAEMWTPDYPSAADELIECVRDAAVHNVPIVVMHAFIGFEDHTPNAYGLESFRKVAEEAGRLGVKVALENTEGEEYLAALMESLADLDNVGFCLDTGHEMCYNHSKDLLSLYGDRLIATHINDNLGIRDFSGKTTWIDDLHLLPFDGIGDWEGFVTRLDEHAYTGPLTFELNAHHGKPNRHENDLYAGLSPQMFFTLAYMRACKLARLREVLAARRQG